MNRKDLIVLAADKDMEHALKGLLSRPQALGIRTINSKTLRQPVLRDASIMSEPPGRLAGIQGDRHPELCLKINNRPKSII